MTSQRKIEILQPALFCVIQRNCAPDTAVTHAIYSLEITAGEINEINQLWFELVGESIHKFYTRTQTILIFEQLIADAHF